MTAVKQLDAIDLHLVALLQEDDRLGLADIGQRVGLAPSSVNDRIKRLVDRGVVRGFNARLSPEALGFELLAFVFVGWADPKVEGPFLRRIAQEAAVQECHHVTGAWNYLMKVRLRNTRELEQFLSNAVKGVGGVERTETLIVLSSAKETLAVPLEPPTLARSDKLNRPKRRKPE